MKTVKIKTASVVLSFCFLMLGCGGSGGNGPLKGQRAQSIPGTPGGVNGQSKQEALKNKALLELNLGISRIQQINADQILLGLTFKLNSQLSVFRTLKMDIKTNEEKSWEGREFDLAQDTRLNFQAFRFLSSTNVEFLALHFKFENRNQQPATTSSSVYLLKLDSDNRVQLAKESYIYPQTNNLQLRDWVRQSQAPNQPNALRDIEFE
ncbi:MAG: hypothetical protein ACK5W9_11590 [Bdellovibrionales bacterium]